jgi:hypothetical protein
MGETRILGRRGQMGYMARTNGMVMRRALIVLALAALAVQTAFELLQNSAWWYA